MTYLIETSILTRLANADDVDYLVSQNGIATLHRQNETLRTAPQNLIEFRGVATRPVVVNGLGLAREQAETFAAEFEANFSLLPETPDIYPAWEALVQATGVIGKQVHDARLAAICHVYGVTHVLTFNVSHFKRFAAYGPGLVVVSPRDV